MNKITLIGRWTKDTELSYTPGNGTAVLKGTLAVDRRMPNKDGKKEADFIQIVIWGKQAESTANYCGDKGRLIAINGRIQTRNYDHKDGYKVYITEVIAEEVQFLDKGQAQIQEQNTSRIDTEFIPTDDDVPF